MYRYLLIYGVCVCVCVYVCVHACVRVCVCAWCVRVMYVCVCESAPARGEMLNRPFCDHFSLAYTLAMVSCHSSNKSAFNEQ